MVNYEKLTKQKIERFNKKLNINEKYSGLILDYFKKLKQYLPSSSEQMIYAVSVYLVMIKVGTKRTIRRISLVVGCSEIGIQKTIYKLVGMGIVRKEKDGYYIN